jgi:hypothetical protein
VAGCLVSTWPFIRYLYQKEKRLVLIAPGVIYLRAAAQAAGLGIGFVRWLLFR